MNRLNRAMLWNACDISTALFPVLCVFWWNNIIGIHGGKYLLKTPGNAISETLNFKIPLVLLPSRTWAFGVSSKATYYSLLSSYLKSFWQLWVLHTSDLKSNVKVCCSCDYLLLSLLLSWTFRYYCNFFLAPPLVHKVSEWWKEHWKARKNYHV